MKVSVNEDQTAKRRATIGTTPIQLTPSNVSQKAVDVKRSQSKESIDPMQLYVEYSNEEVAGDLALLTH